MKTLYFHYHIINTMTKDEKIKKIELLKNKAYQLKKEVDYYNALQLALKLVLNGSYGAFAAGYFILFNENVAGTITAEGRLLTKTMSEVNREYWYNIWHTDTELHKKLSIKDVIKINENVETSIYGDTDSIFVGIDPAINSCKWKNLLLNKSQLDKIPHTFAILTDKELSLNIDNPNYISTYKSDIKEIDPNVKVLIVDGYFIKNYQVNNLLSSFTGKVMWNWDRELDFIHGVDKFRLEQYFKEKLEEHANSYGVSNNEDFELERVDESIINIQKKKYIQHVVWEDGIEYPRFKYIFPKGVELVRSSTPVFARKYIAEIVEYLFEHPDTYNVKDLLTKIREIRKNFELTEPDDIGGQTSCKKYNEKVLEDKTSLSFVTGAHFSVKAAALHNHILYHNSNYVDKYERIKSGDKIKYYYTTDQRNPVFAWIRGYYPIEFAPPVDYDTHFAKMILSPINNIIEPLGLPEISKRLSVVMDIFSGL
jgi:DNA polymerase elongation subunit (family B)